MEDRKRTCKTNTFNYLLLTISIALDLSRFCHFSSTPKPPKIKKLNEPNKPTRQQSNKPCNTEAIQNLKPPGVSLNSNNLSTEQFINRTIYGHSTSHNTYSSD